MDTRPGQGTAVARSELVILDREAVFSTPGASVLYPYAVITAPSPVLGRRAMQGGAAFGNATGTLRIWVAGLERVAVTRDMSRRGWDPGFLSRNFF